MPIISTIYTHRKICIFLHFCAVCTYIAMFLTCTINIIKQLQVAISTIKDGDEAISS